MKVSAQQVTAIQRFEPFGERHHFMLIGDPDVVIDGHIQDPAKVKGLIAILRQGVAQHSKVAELWDRWDKP